MVTLGVTLGPSALGPVDFRLPADPRVRVRLLDLGLACCSLEVEATVVRGLLASAPRPGGEDAPSVTDEGVTLNVLLVSGTVTDALAPAVIRAYRSMPDPVAVMSFGACASTGGPYWDAPTVTKGIDQLIPVDVFVPGCPPRPEALVAGLLSLLAENA